MLSACPIIDLVIKNFCSAFNEFEKKNKNARGKCRFVSETFLVPCGWKRKEGQIFGPRRS